MDDLRPPFLGPRGIEARPGRSSEEGEAGSPPPLLAAGVVFAVGVPESAPAAAAAAAFAAATAEARGPVGGGSLAPPPWLFPPREAAASIAEARASAAAVESDDARIASWGRAPKREARCILHDETRSSAAGAAEAPSTSERERLSPAVFFVKFFVFGWSSNGKVVVVV